MGSTNKTSNYELSQFLGSDSPKWLTDYNADMQKIDAGIAAVKTQADATDLTVAGHTSTISNLSSEVGDQTTAIQQIRGDVTGLQGTVNTITSLIGNGEPTTTDKTLIGAINELKDDIDAIAPSGDIEADDVAYNNTTSGLTATNVQAAIDELATGTPAAATVEAQRGTIAVGSTSATLTFDATIGATTFVDWYIGDGTIVPTSVTTTAHTVVITIPAQSDAVPVGAVIRN